VSYEIEKRSKLNSKEEFEKLKEFLDKNSEFLGKKNMIAMLFRKPDYLRIRKENDKIVITHKAGGYFDKARRETEFEIKQEELQDFINKKEKEGYKEYAEIKKERYSYLYKDLHVELNMVENMGLIVEVEAVTDKEEKIDELNEKISKTIKELRLEELSPKKYKEMMDSLYQKALKTVRDSPII
jgi:predicted adenylyl cyclase CyaB